MTEGGPAQMGATHSSGTVPPFLRGGLNPLPEVGGRRLSTFTWGSYEDAKLWTVSERRRRATSPLVEPLGRKGPAFWNKAPVRAQQEVGAPPARRRRLRVPCVDCCVCPRPTLKMTVCCLIILSLILFCVLISLITIYVVTARQLSDFTERMEGQKHRLVEAVRNVARSQRLSCEACQKNWMQIADACYLFTPEIMSWRNCVDHCIAQGASLLIAYTEGEMLLVMMETEKQFTIINRKVLSKAFWIGLMYNHTAQNWLWADGVYLHIKMSITKVTSSLVEDFCVVLHSGQMDRKKCTYVFHCLCKRAAS